MIEKRFFMTVALIFLIAPTAYSQPSALNIKGLVGKVKRVDEKSTQLIESHGKTRQSDLPAHSMVFDKNGELTFETYFTLEGNSETKYSNESNGVRKQVNQRNRPFAKSNEQFLPTVSASIFKYDPAAKMISEDHYDAIRQTGPVYDANSLTQRYKYYFNSANRLTKNIVLARSGKEIMTYEYTFRGDGPPNEQIISAHGRAFELTKFVYEMDAKGNWIKRTGVTESFDPKVASQTWVTIRKIDYYDK